MRSGRQGMVRARVGAAASGTAFVALGLAMIGWAAGYAASQDRARTAPVAAPLIAEAPILAEELWPAALPPAPLEAVIDHVAAEAAPALPAPDPFAQLTTIGLPGEALRARVQALGTPLGALASFDLSRIDPSLIDDEARACLTQAIYYEARDQSVTGRMAVADVVMNRVASRRYPATVCGVVYQGATRRAGCQFSFTCDGSMNAAATSALDRRAMTEARTLATAVLGGWHLPLTGGATHYHADYVTPGWASRLHETAVIGDHVFYRRGGARPVKLASAG